MHRDGRGRGVARDTGVVFVYYKYVLLCSTVLKYKKKEKVTHTCQKNPPGNTSIERFKGFTREAHVDTIWQYYTPVNNM